MRRILRNPALLALFVLATLYGGTKGRPRIAWDDGLVDAGSTATNNTLNAAWTYDMERIPAHATVVLWQIDSASNAVAKGEASAMDGAISATLDGNWTNYMFAVTWWWQPPSVTNAGWIVEALSADGLAPIVPLGAAIVVEEGQEGEAEKQEDDP